jgi:hypothetical protein
MKLRVLSIVSVCVAAAALALDSALPSAQTAERAADHVAPATIVAPADKRRAEEQTFLTFPEWYLVYSPQEYADYVQDGPPSRFPFLGHLGQFWQGYWMSFQATKGVYPFNSEYHLMVLVIGTSTTAEYGLKWIYEATVGRMAEASCLHDMTAEDRLNAAVSWEYAEFLDLEPWYKFDYPRALRRLWTETGYWGTHPLRKWERKYFLTTEYAIKAVYAKLLRQGTESTYGVEETTTTVLLDKVPPKIAVGALPKLNVIKHNSDGTVLAELPRYQPFTKYASVLATCDVGFVEIAGNRGKVLISAVVPEKSASLSPETEAEMLMTQPIMTRPGTKRIVFDVPVAKLKQAILELQAPQTRLEHIYDY